jgi:hypothetical protein
MKALGCPAIRLGIPELEYRPKDVGQNEIVGRVAEEVAPLVAESSEIWVPAGIGGHADHIATRDGVLASSRALGSSVAIRLYADQPYSIIMYGWPSWVTGVPDGEYLDIDAWLEQELISCGLDPSILVVDVRELDPEIQQCKETAVMAYRTQLPGIGLGPNASRRWRDLLSHELSWQFKA